jgi:hypothetical protein
MSLDMGLCCISYIANSYNNKPLRMATEQGFLNWDNYPVLLSSSEIQSMNFPYIVQILSNSLQSHSQIISLQSNQICPLISILNEKHLEVLSKYFDELKIACEKDAKKIAGLERRYKKIKYSIPLATGLISAGMLPKSPNQNNSSYIKLAAVFTIGTVAGYFLGSHILQTYLRREGSTHRIECLLKIDREEKVRLEAMKQDILSESERLESELKELEEEGETDIQKKEYAQQLSQLRTLFFPSDKALENT